MHIERVPTLLKYIPKATIILLKGKPNRKRYIKKLTDCGYKKINFFDILDIAAKEHEPMFAVLPCNNNVYDSTTFDQAIIDHCCAVVECEPMYNDRSCYVLTVNIIREKYQLKHAGLPMKEYRNWPSEVKEWLKNNYLDIENKTELLERIEQLM